MERLSTGLRVNRASDDAAGLSVSEQLRTQVRGAQQADRNTQDTVALLQIAEGALNEVHSILQRGRELAVQAANATLTETDRTYLQQEVDALMVELDRVNDSTTYNGKKILGGVDSTLAESITEGLQSSWLQAAETLVNTTWSLGGNNETMKIIIEDNGEGGTAAYVQGRYYGTGQLVSGSLELHVDSADFGDGYDKTGTAAEQSGGTAPFYADRIIAHELTHAAMAASIGNFNNLETWFTEATAEYTHGAKERVDSDITKAGGLNNLISSATLAGGWAGDSAHYSTAYIAAVALDTNGGANAVGSNIANIVSDLAGGSTLDQAINNNTIWGSTAAFEAAFDGGVGATTYTNVISGFGGTGALSNVGASATGIVADLAGAATDDPLSSYAEEWEPTTGPLMMQIGANANDIVDQVTIAISGVSSSALGLESVEVTGQTAALGAIGSFDEAIESVSERRSDLGAWINRMEHTSQNLQNAATNQQDAESRIRDTDFATESTTFTRNQILTQSATSILSQANAIPAMALNLISL